MKYMGSKNRHAKDILPIILKDRGSRTFVEPFCGGCNLMDKVTGSRLGGDVHSYLMAMWSKVSEGWRPPAKFSEREYHEMKKSPENFRPELVGYVGFALSYGGKWFGGWRRDSKGVRDYVGESYRSAMKQFPLLEGVDFSLASYDELDIPDDSIVYCDPPYANTTKYLNDFNSGLFWDWVRSMSVRHAVFVSEYEAPDDFITVWSKPVSSSLSRDTGSVRAVEKLFTYGGM